MAIEAVGDMKLLKGHLAGFLHLGFILVVLGGFQFGSNASAAAFKLNLSPQLPMTVELIVAGNDETGNADRVAPLIGVARWGAIITVQAVVLETGYHLAIAADAELLIVIVGLR